jgi:hypothetical protein
MDREEIKRRLQAIVNEITCMNNEDFEMHLKGEEFEITFDHHGWAGPQKIVTKISMKKVDIIS